MENFVGRTIGDCKINEKIGEGGMGAVYFAEHQSLEISVAIKIVDSALISRDPTFIDRFYREARQAAKLNHPNIMRVYNVGEDQSVHFLIVEFIDGPSLAEIIALKEQLPLEIALPLMMQAFEGMKIAHSKGILHRDIKPDNLLVNSEGILKITDFGLAKPIEQRESLVLTSTGHILGTPAYMPLEQWRGEKLNEQSDIYSLGVTFFHLLSGHYPYEGRTVAELLTKIISGKNQKLNKLVPDLPKSIVNVIERMIHVRMEKRPESCDAVINQLNSIVYSGELLRAELKNDSSKIIGIEEKETRPNSQIHSGIKTNNDKFPFIADDENTNPTPDSKIITSVYDNVTGWMKLVGLSGYRAKLRLYFGRHKYFFLLLVFFVFSIIFGLVFNLLTDSGPTDEQIQIQSLRKSLIEKNKQIFDLEEENQELKKKNKQLSSKLKSNNN